MRALLALSLCLGLAAVAGGASVSGIPMGRDLFGQVIFTNGVVTQAHITTR